MSISGETLAEINNMINKDVEFRERRKFTTLTVGKIYGIRKMTFMTTRFGRTIVVTLYDPTDGAMFDTFLPKRVVEMLTADIFETMSKSCDKYTLTYLGQSSNILGGGGGGGNTRALFNFGCLEGEV